MSYTPFDFQDLPAATLSNLVVFKKQVVIASGTPNPTDYVLATTDATYGSFTPTDVRMHVDSAVVTNTFTSQIGHNATFDNMVASNTKGSAATLALQLNQFKFDTFTLRNASTYFNNATPANVATDIKLRVTTPPASNATITFFVVGYYTGMRP